METSRGGRGGEGSGVPGLAHGGSKIDVKDGKEGKKKNHPHTHTQTQKHSCNFMLGKKQEAEAQRRNKDNTEVQRC